jgi:hypothetical protein
MPKKKVEKKKSETTFVKIDEPLLFRKEILSTAIGATNILKSYEAYGLLRDKKIKLMKKIKSLMKKIEKEFSIIRETHLPKIEKIEREIEMQGKKVHPAKKPVQIKKTVIEKTGLDKEIDAIRAKLNELNS